MSRQRLHRQIYRSLLVVALVAIVLTAVTSHLFQVERFRSPFAERLLSEARHLGHLLPPSEPSQGALSRILAARSRDLELEAAVLDADGRLLATTASGFPPAGWLSGPHRQSFSRYYSIVHLELPDGRLLAVRPRHPPKRHLLFVPALIVLVVALAIGSRKAARRITRRIETLEDGVKALGGGTLSARVSVEGSDEVASLAQTFNWAADRIERLVGSQRRMLAAASHELRSPLARLRLLLELLREREQGDDVERRLVEGITDIEELDALVEDLLLASRLEATSSPIFTETVDLGELVRSEAARFGVASRVVPVSVPGERRLLQRLVRNLLENAERHGAGAEVEVGVEPLSDDGARLWVADRGPGVPAEERQRVFEPFYKRPEAGSERGVGLGLDLVRRIARHHGGDAACRERQGGGALFEVSLSPGSAEETGTGIAQG